MRRARAPFQLVERLVGGGRTFTAVPIHHTPFLELRPSFLQEAGRLGMVSQAVPVDLPASGMVALLFGRPGPGGVEEGGGEFDVLGVQVL